MAAKKKKSSTQAKNSSARTNDSRTGTKPEVSSLVKKEGILLIALGISIFLFCANFGLGPEWIDALGRDMRDFFGYLNYIFPVGIFVGVAFWMANPNNFMAKLKLVAAISNYIVFLILFSLLLPGDEGFLGGFFGALLTEALGLPITIVLLILFVILNFVLITEKSFFHAVEQRGKKVYKSAREDVSRRKEQNTERRRLQERKNRECRDENGKAYGVPMNMVIGEEPSAEKSKENLHEIIINGKTVVTNNRYLAAEEPDGQFAFEAEPEEVQEPVKKNPEENFVEEQLPKQRKRRSVGKKSEGARVQETAEEISREIQKQAPPKDKNYVFPPVSLLKKSPAVNNVNSNRTLTDLARRLEQALLSFGVKVTVTNVTCGPSVTRFELQPEQGTKVSRITSLEDDIKMNLAATTIRIEAPIPGKSAIGIEIPNEKTSPVLFRDLIESYELKNHTSKIAFGAGKDISGKVVVGDIAKFPHMLVAGSTGSGKSVYTNSIIMSILYRATPEEVRLIIIDPKVVEFQVYDGIPHLLIPVVTDPKKAAGALNWAVAEMTDRYNKFAELRVRSLSDYNEKIQSMKTPEGQEPPKALPQIVIIIDELADLMMIAKNEVESAIVRIAQLARAAGIHMIIATQRPSVDVVTGLIKANMPSRTSLLVSSGTDSRVIIDQVGAEKLLGNGDMLFYPAGFKYPERVQGAFVSTEEIENTVAFLKEKNQEVEYNQAIEESMNAALNNTGHQGGSVGENDDLDEYFIEAGRYVIKSQKGSIGSLQRVFKVGFNRAARIMQQLCDAGVVGEEQAAKQPREVLMTSEEFEQYIEKFM